MSTGIRYTDEFKRDAVAQITDRGYSLIVSEVTSLLKINDCFDLKRTIKY